MKHKLLIVALFSVFTYSSFPFFRKAQNHVRNGSDSVQLISSDWKFIRYGLQSDGTRIDEPKGLQATELSDSHWKSVNLPHDFAIAGPFRIELAGNIGKLPYKGIGWYRKEFQVSSEDLTKHLFIDFDGVMANAKVWCNGSYVGEWPYGYSSFRFDLSKYLRKGKNVVALRTDTEHWDSRWYSGAGIYRNVWLTKSNDIHVNHWGSFITTKQLSAKLADLSIELNINNLNSAVSKVDIYTDIYELNPNDSYGKKVKSLKEKDIQLKPNALTNHKQALTIKRPNLWSAETPFRYVAKHRIYQNRQLVESYSTAFGIRKIEFTKHDILVNGKSVYLKGVCMHHDLGALGSAVNKSAISRQLKILKSMGCNAIRTSHNPPSPELLEMCDKLGFYVMDEAFDCWERGKKPWDYHKLYKDWHHKDLEALVMRDRNHPSVMMWSVGNEVMEQTNVEMNKHLADIVRSFDSSRPVTNGFSYPNQARASGAALQMDIMGINYSFGQQAKWDADERYEDMPTIGTETSSCLSSRGVYFLKDTLRKNFQVSSYDLDHPGWGCTPDKQFRTNHKFPTLLGEFVWTGFDYLGEPNPFNSDETNLLNFRNDPKKRQLLAKKLEELKKTTSPARSSYFGIIDLAGFPKDRYYLYQSQWLPEHRMAHLLPHWSWKGCEGDTIPVHVYTSGDEAELFVNGKSYGRKRMREGKDFRLVWDNVIYEPGYVQVIAYKNNMEWARDTRYTSLGAFALKLTTNKKVIKNDGVDYAFITVEVIDKNGNIDPVATNKIQFTVEGAGEIVATDNGDPTDFNSFKSHSRHLFSGKALVIVKSKEGNNFPFVVHATSPSLRGESIKIKIKK